MHTGDGTYLGNGTVLGVVVKTSLIICSGVSGIPFHATWVQRCAGRRAASKAETGWTPHGEPAQPQPSSS
jgi:hypothetical protein